MVSLGANLSSLIVSLGLDEEQEYRPAKRLVAVRASRERSLLSVMSIGLEINGEGAYGEARSAREVSIRVRTPCVA